MKSPASLASPSFSLFFLSSGTPPGSVYAPHPVLQPGNCFQSVSWGSFVICFVYFASFMEPALSIIHFLKNIISYIFPSICCSRQESLFILGQLFVLGSMEFSYGDFSLCKVLPHRRKERDIITSTGVLFYLSNFKSQSLKYKILMEKVI